MSTITSMKLQLSIIKKALPWVLSLSCLVSPTALQAQTPAPAADSPASTEQHPKKGDHKNWEHLMKSLDLTDAQKEALKNQHQATRAEAQKIKEDSTLSKEEKKSRFEALRENAKKQRDAILTPAQVEKLNQMRANKDDRGSKEDHQNMGDHKNGEKLMKSLDLTDAQKEALKNHHQATRAEAQKIKEDSTLSKEEKKTRLEELHANAKKQRDAILTPAQVEKLNQMRANKENRGNGKNSKSDAPKQ